jgi:hypothetical protein
LLALANFMRTCLEPRQEIRAARLFRSTFARVNVGHPHYPIAFPLLLG